MTKNPSQHYRDILFGVAIGDALGVPVEFESRQGIALNPVVDMRGYGSHNMPPGTFSDDSSLTLCLAEALTHDFNLKVIAENFVQWLYNNYWTATGSVFDVGIATQGAIDRLVKGTRPDLAGGMDVDSNGNGSLMRTLPLIMYTRHLPISKRYEVTKQISSITHAHIRSVIACFYYLEFALGLINGEDKFTIYQRLQITVAEHLRSLSINGDEIKLFNRLLINQIDMIPEEQISGSGYVLHSLEASIWCILTTSSYKDAVLKAVNLGEDTDTTGAVTGGLAGLLYGHQTIPENWLNQLARKNDIDNLAERMYKKLG